MPEPTTATIAATALAATGITVAGVATGLNFEILLAGFAGALASLSYLGNMTVLKTIWTLLSSTLFAGYLAPIIGSSFLLFGHQGTTTSVGSGFIIGMVAQVLIPAIMRWSGRKVDNQERNPTE